MKNTFKTIIAIALGAASVCSCNLLDIKYDNALSASNMWQDPSDLEQSVPMIYQRLRSYMSANECNVFYLGELRVGDSVWGPSLESNVADNFKRAVRHSTLTSSNTIGWSGLYSAIDQANAVLAHSSTCGATQDRVDWANGQAYFARAYCYFLAARTWGYVPLNLKPVESTIQEECYPEQSTPAEVYAQVEKDINACIELAGNLGSEKYFATKDAANLLKADYALWMYTTQDGGDSYLAMADEALTAMNISSSKLLTDYAKVFDRTNKKNAEDIFCLCNSSSSTGGYQTYFCQPANLIASAYQNNPVPVGSTQWWAQPQSMVDQYKAQEALGDTRVKTNLGYGPYSAASDHHELTWCNKLLGDMSKQPVVQDNDLIYYRYGYAVMLLAELKYYQKDYAASLAALNIIAQRAYGKASYYNETRPAQLLDLIVKEYYYEFPAEGMLWYALIRTGKIWDIVPDSEHPTQTFATMKESNPNILLWPIANGSLTKNHKLHQVDGWS